MERVSVPCTNDTVPPTEGDGAARLGRASIASNSQREEAPELLADYLERIGRSQLLTPREEAEFARRARSGYEKASRVLIEKTPAELGDELGITRERVRQLQRNAERRLGTLMTGAYRVAPERCRRDPSHRRVDDRQGRER